jgi:2'-5' RNA ligase
MTNRWEKRIEPALGQRVLYWHILLGENLAVQAIADIGRRKLAVFNGLHFTPRQWLHVTVLVAGSIDDFSDSRIEAMMESVTESLSEVQPVTARLDRVMYHPEAIVLKVRPDGVLDEVYAAVRSATGIASCEHHANGIQRWSPHMTLAYSTSTQAAQPIIDTLGLELPVCEVRIDRINLVVQEGPERLWRWHPIAEVTFGTSGVGS